MFGLSVKSRKPVETGLPQVPAGQRIYCIGDIHGRADLLLELHAMIRNDAAGHQGDNTVVYLGDYIDRGAQSREVIETLLVHPLAGFEAIYLLGNHEQSMLDFMDYPEAVAAWLTYGGRETLDSYGLAMARLPALKELPALAAQLKDTLPVSHRVFLQNCRDAWQCGSYYFVHAGIRPGVALDQQLREDQIWIRDEFLHSDRDHGAMIVHGHTISLEPELLPNRIGIDTGAYATGVLTCLVLEGSAQRLLQTGMEA